MSENQSQTAAGSGNSPEKLVADFVESSWDHITQNGFDLLADVAIDMLVKNGSVPSDAYLHAVKTSWCLHRAAVHYARQHGVERAAADRARGDAQFEHSHRAQAERKAEKLEADLAQSVLLVENQRLRMEEMRERGDDRCKKSRAVQQKLETAEAALLEQQQRNEELVTRGTQQRMKIAELERRVAALQQKPDGKTQESQVETTPAKHTFPEGWRVVPLGEPLRGGDEYDSELERYIRRIEPQPQPEKTITPDEVAAQQLVRGLVLQVAAAIEQQETAEQPQPVPQYRPPEGWRVLAVGERLQLGDMTVRSDGYCYSTERVGYFVGANQRYIRRIDEQPEPQPQPVQVREGRWLTRSGEVKYIRDGGSLRDNYYSWPWTDGVMCWQYNGLYQASKPSENDLVQYLGPIESEAGSEQIAS